MNRPYAAKLQELLEASSNLPNAVCDLGRVELGPVELEDITHRIYNHEKSGIDAKAHYLLATSGFNAEQVLSEIGQLRFRESDTDKEGQNGSVSDSNSTVAQRDAVLLPNGLTHSAQTNQTSGGFPQQSQSNQQSHLQQHLQHQLLSNNITGPSPSQFQDMLEMEKVDKPSVWDPIVAQTAREFDEFVDKQIKVDWNSRKREVLSFLGRKPSKMRSENDKSVTSFSSNGSAHPNGASDNGFSKFSSTSTSILGSPGGDNKPLTPIMKQYAKLVTSLCDHELEAPHIVSQFSEVAKSYESEPYIRDGWKVMELDDPLTFLQQQFWEFLNAEISARRQSAKLGGAPTAFSKVKAYVHLKYYRMGKWDPRITMVNKTPIWAYLYYLVRSGFIDDALKLVLERTDIFSTVGSSFAVFFKAWAESPTHTLSPHYAEMIHAEYHQQFRPGRSFDPYRQALCKIIGRCELSKRTLPEVAVTTEDWLWLQLMLCRSASDPVTTAVPASRYTIEDLRSYILDIGQSHLASNPTKYFTILGLLGLWTEAVAFLQEHDEFNAVHFAIALAASKNKNYKGDLTTLVGHYTRHFRQSLPNLAVDYLVLLSLSPKTHYVDPAASSIEATGSNSQLAAREALRELVLDTRRFAELLGDVTIFTDQSFPGSIEKRMALVGLNDRQEYLYSIAHRAAEIANRKGHTLDAILLYRLAKEPQHVFTLVNSHLGLLLSGVPVGQRVETSLAASYDFIQLARNVLRIDSDALHQNQQVPNKSRQTCLQLLAISECFDLVANKEYQRCLMRIAQTGLLVLSPEPAVEEVRALSEQFLTYDESLACNIPNLLLIAMTCIVRHSESLPSLNNPSIVNSQVLQQNRGMANNCMVYAGLIQFRMPREVYAKLTQLDAL